MTNSINQLGHMKVKSAELKTHLSHYLRLVQETGEDIEVCVRETPVAYLSRTKEPPMNTALQLETRQLEASFQTVGLTLAPPLASIPTTRRVPVPTVAGDGRTDVDTIQETRRQRDW
jgi:antitoxin (DNA-binding transcriptional repressor) of toxin-antitoxin stability system